MNINIDIYSNYLTKKNEKYWILTNFFTAVLYLGYTVAWMEYILYMFLSRYWCIGQGEV